MEQIILNVIEQFGYIGICLLIAVENIFPPIPSEVILTFGGFMTTFSSMNIWLVILVATIGSVIGALVLYAIGRFLSTERLEKLVQGKFGKVMHLKSEDIQKAEKWFGEHGNKAVFFCRFVPIVRSLISIPAGITKMKLSSFLILTISGTFIWNVGTCLFGKICRKCLGNNCFLCGHLFDNSSCIFYFNCLDTWSCFHKKEIYCE
jgi:membrane protein DedA with SNARE-associated domain